MKRLLAAAFALTLPSVAVADALGPPPTDCARGSRGRTARVGTWCEPTTCGEGQPACEGYWCPEGRYSCGDERRPYTCSDDRIALCVRTRTRVGHRRTIRGVSRVEREVTESLGPCGPSDRCDDGATCERVRRCVPAETATTDVRRFVEPSPEAEPEPGADLEPAAEAAPEGEDEPGAPGDALPPEEAGCGCRVGATRGAGAGLCWGLLALALGARRRRHSAGAAGRSRSSGAMSHGGSGTSSSS